MKNHFIYTMFFLQVNISVTLPVSLKLEIFNSYAKRTFQGKDSWFVVPGLFTCTDGHDFELVDEELLFINCLVNGSWKTTVGFEKTRRSLLGSKIIKEEEAESFVQEIEEALLSWYSFTYPGRGDYLSNVCQASFLFCTPLNDIDELSLVTKNCLKNDSLTHNEGADLLRQDLVCIKANYNDEDETISIQVRANVDNEIYDYRCECNKSNWIDNLSLQGFLLSVQKRLSLHSQVTQSLGLQIEKELEKIFNLFKNTSLKSYSSISKSEASRFKKICKKIFGDWSQLDKIFKRA